MTIIWRDHLAKFGSPVQPLRRSSKSFSIRYTRPDYLLGCRIAQIVEEILSPLYQIHHITQSGFLSQFEAQQDLQQKCSVLQDVGNAVLFFL